MSASASARRPIKERVIPSGAQAEKAELLKQIPTTHLPRYAAAAKQRRAARKQAAAAPLAGGEAVP